MQQHLRFFAEIGVTHLKIEKPADRIASSPAEVPVPAAGGQQESGPDQAAPRVQTLEQVRAELGDCQRCKLCSTRTQIVYGVGSPTADLMFVGEAPGADEDARGVPFVGRAGQLLTKIIEGIDLTREQVYIANILKCRPPRNRNPEDDEVAACQPFLKAQIAAIQPLIIVALGKYAAQTLVGTDTTISNMRGQFYDYEGTRLMPTFHPSYLLRNSGAKKPVWEDVKKVRATLTELGSAYYS